MADILLIEDDPHQRAYAAAVLASVDHQVREAGNGEQGLQLARVRPPELVVCDVLMPGTNGYQFLAMLRADPLLCAVPVIMLTSLAGRAQVRAGMTAGADDYLPKPFQPLELLDAVDALLRHRRAQQEALSDRFSAALERQKEVLGARYEAQMLQELQARWRSTVASGGELALPDAVLLAANLFDLIQREADSPEGQVKLLRQVYEAAADALYLFGAAQVLMHGGDLMAVFRPDVLGHPAVPHALRGATALHAAVARVLGRTVAASEPSMLPVGIALGPLALLHLQDPLHGDGGVAILPGPTPDHAKALREAAAERGWWVAGSGALAAAAPADIAVGGRRSRVKESGRRAVEMLRPGS